MNWKTFSLKILYEMRLRHMSLGHLSILISFEYSDFRQISVQPPENEINFIPSGDSFRQSGAVHPTHKIMSLVRGIVKRFGKNGQLVVDLCAGFFMIANAGQIWLKYLQFIGCKMDPLGFNISVCPIIEMFLRHSPNSKSGLLAWKAQKR